MIRFFVLRILLPFFLFFLFRSIFRSVLLGRNAERPQRPSAPSAGELKKDPVCGTYVSTATAITSKTRGVVVYFCSEECRKKFV
jgi:uncharacterized protein